MKLFILLLCGIALLITIPLLVIWSLNTLFAFAIPYTIETWFAVLVLSFAISGNAKNCHSKCD